MSKYMISLTPMGRFFFGGDMAFSAKKNGEEKSEYPSYIISSNKFPQQTSLLGMLRFLVLRNDENAFDSAKQKIINKIQAKKLIGPKSFMITGEKGDYGKIKNLEPCFLQVKCDNEWTDLEIVPKDEDFKVTFSEDIFQKTHAVINGKKVDIPNMNYNAKGDYPTCYHHGNEVVKEGKIFEEEITNGIDRDIETGKVDDNALFKKISYRLKEGFRFAFYAEVELEGFDNYCGQLVSVGGDSSQFVIGIEKCPAEEQKEQMGYGKRVILTSPAYLTKEDFRNQSGEEMVRYAITDTMPFKCMQTKTEEVEAYNKISRKYAYSEQYFLYVPGSVFYFKTEDDAQAFTKSLKSHSDFYQIGYNHYIVK